jgi:hypothetical protein
MREPASERGKGVRNQPGGGELRRKSEKDVKKEGMIIVLDPANKRRYNARHEKT